MQLDNGIMSLIAILNAVTFIAFLYCLFSVVSQVIKRFKNKKAGIDVSPISKIILGWLKYSLIAAVILIPAAGVITYYAGQAAGLAGSEIFVMIVTQAVVGNIATSFIFGYIILRMKKSARQSLDNMSDEQKAVWGK